MSVDYKTIKQKVMQAANECIGRGHAYSQEKVVFDHLQRDFGGSMYSSLDFDLQQVVLTCWHDLFRDGVLSWGIDFDNPGPPFFHLSQRPGRENQP